MPSISGPLRMAIGPQKQNLKTHFENAKLLQQQPVPEDIPSQTAKFTEIEEMAMKLATSIDSLNASNNNNE